MQPGRIENHHSVGCGGGDSRDTEVAQYPGDDFADGTHCIRKLLGGCHVDTNQALHRQHGSGIRPGLVDRRAGRVSAFPLGLSAATRQLATASS